VTAAFQMEESLSGLWTMISANSAKSSAISALNFHRGDRGENPQRTAPRKPPLSITVGAKHSGTERGSSDSFAQGISKSMDVMELRSWQTVRRTSAATGVFGELPKTHKKSAAICAWQPGWCKSLEIRCFGASASWSVHGMRKTKNHKGH
jgi:hypothetical protein